MASLAASLLVPSVASADPVDDKRNEAKQVADKLHELELSAEMLTEEYNDAVLKQQQLQVEVDAATTRADEAKAELEQRRTEMAAFAVDAYVMGGTEAQVPSTLKHDPKDSAKLQEYADAAIGDRPKLIKQFRKAKADAEKQIEDLKTAKAEADEVSKTVDVKMNEARAAVDEQQRTYNTIQADLQQLVAAEQDARSPRIAAGPTSPRGGPIPPPGSGAGAAIQAAKSQLGVPWVWAASTPGVGFDCSGLVMWAWGRGGKSLPHSSKSLYSMSRKIAKGDAQPGDLVFYGRPSVHHVAIYIGGGQIIHSPGSGKDVRIQSIDYWDEFVAVGRV
jgi:cell wall-associated NlpC family hydrolase